MLASCSGETGAPKTTGAAAEASDATKATAGAKATTGAPAPAVGKAPPSAATVTPASARAVAEKAGSAAATPGAPVAAVVAGATPADGVKPAAPGEKPLWDGSETPDVDAMFPARKQPNEPLPEELLKQIRYRMRDVSKAPIALRDAIYLPREDGSAEVLAIYEVSTYEDCVQRHGGSRKKARAACLPEVQTLSSAETGDEDTKVRLNRNCRNYGVVRASLSARELIDDADRLKVSALELPQASCELRSLQQFFLDDIDRDGRPELVIAATAARELIEDQRRSQAVVIEEERLLWVLDVGAALTEQLQLSVAKYSSDARTVWVDLNRDERPDLVQIADCRRDELYDEEDRCDESLRDRTWYLYDREADRWRDDEAPPPKARATKPAGDKPSDLAGDKPSDLVGDKPSDLVDDKPSDQANDKPSDKAAGGSAAAGKPAPVAPAAGGAQ